MKGFFLHAKRPLLKNKEGPQNVFLRAFFIFKNAGVKLFFGQILDARLLKQELLVAQPV